MNSKRIMKYFVLFLLSVSPLIADEKDYLEFEGMQGVGQGKNIVLISGGEYYRSEEALPQLAKILSQQHGFNCSVHFAIDPRTKIINPDILDNIPGLEKLVDADLMIIFARFRCLPDDQMKFVDDYVKSGKPVMGIRSAHHAFSFTTKKWAHYNSGFSREVEGVDRNGGFGGRLFAQDVCDHISSGDRHSTQGYPDPENKDHPILRGIADGDIWGPSDIYSSTREGKTPLVLGRALKAKESTPINGPFLRKRPTDKVDPDIESGTAIAWIKTDSDKRYFYSSVGVSGDLLSYGTRRLFINAAFWCLKMENKIPAAGLRADLVEPYSPTAITPDIDWPKLNLKLDDFE